MLGKILFNGLLLLGLLLTPAWAEDLLPSNVKNTALEDFGIVALAGDYGLGNVTPLEIVMGREGRREVRVFRSPELHFWKQRAKMQVLLGNIRGAWIWVETPPVQGDWHLTVDLLHMDGTREQIVSQDMKPGVRQFVGVLPHTRVECHVSTKIKGKRYIPRKFVLTVSPVDSWAIWPDYLPIPFIPTIRYE